MKSIKAKIILGTLLLMLCSLSISAQSLPPVFNGGDNNIEDTAAPISSLVALGLIAGAAYGIKKMR